MSSFLAYADARPCVEQPQHGHSRHAPVYVRRAIEVAYFDFALVCGTARAPVRPAPTTLAVTHNMVNNCEKLNGHRR
jgi:hypothetical protein